MLRYAITNGSRFKSDSHVRNKALLADARRWAEAGIDYVQLREKTMNAGDLLSLTNSMMFVFREYGSRTKLLVNGRADVALAGDADGVHLTAHPAELTPIQVRQLFQKAGARTPLVGISCHTTAEVKRAREMRADLVLFGPVFEKQVDAEVVVEGSGLDTLHLACIEAQSVPLFALGGITAENTQACIDAGAAGIAGIRLFT